MANLYDRVARLEREIDTLRRALLQNPEAGRYERSLAARQHEHCALTAQTAQLDAARLVEVTPC